MTDNTMAKRKRQTMMDKTLHRKWKMEQHELYQTPGMISGVPGVNYS
jgi:hypothetical protein